MRAAFLIATCLRRQRCYMLPVREACIRPYVTVHCRHRRFRLGSCSNRPAPFCSMMAAGHIIVAGKLVLGVSMSERHSDAIEVLSMQLD